jgi:hypothetical protein
VTRNDPIQLKIDHVTVAGSSLRALENAFAGVGLNTDFGGPHSNGITQMSLLGFTDGSYIELISSLAASPVETAFWGRHIKGNAGPCAWAARVDSVATEAARVAALGVWIDGPHYYNRRRPDQKLVEWELAFLGRKSAGATLPFIIKDITPRQLRVQPSESVAGSPNKPALLTGVVNVVLAVQEPIAAAETFQRVYHWPPPTAAVDSRLQANLLHFAGTPVTLASPPNQDSWLAQRLAQFDDSPCAYLLGASDFDAACRRFDLRPADNWFGRRCAWFDPTKLNGTHLGIIELDSG